MAWEASSVRMKACLDRSVKSLSHPHAHDPPFVRDCIEYHQIANINPYYSIQICLSKRSTAHILLECEIIKDHTQFILWRLHHQAAPQLRISQMLCLAAVLMANEAVARQLQVEKGCPVAPRRPRQKHSRRRNSRDANYKS